MNAEMKRRVFLTGIIGSLIGAPIVARLLLRREPDEAHRFSDLLKTYRELLDVPVEITSDRGPASLALKPPNRGEWKYVLFSQSFLPPELSRATLGEPDSYVAREGNLFLGETNGGKILLGGGDTRCEVWSPFGMEPRDRQTVTLLCSNGRLSLAKVKGTATPDSQDTLLRHLLALENSSHQNLAPRKRWRGTLGRIKPYGGYSTDYEVAGFATVGGRAVIDIAFSGTVDLTAPPAGKSGGTAPLVTNRHRGHAWFDLETGFLLRQETEQEAVAAWIPGFRAKDGSDKITVNTQSLFHLFTS